MGKKKRNKSAVKSHPEISEIAPVFSDARVAWALGLLIFGVFAYTAAPEVTAEDSGDFIMGAATLGLVHAPGYPLYTLLAHLFSLLPVPGSIAYRVHLFSAFCGAAAISVLFLVLRRLSINWIAAAFAALSFAFTANFWSQCTIAEVYSLNVLLIALCFLAVLNVSNSDNLRAWGILGLVLGLGLSNHYPLFILSTVGFLPLVPFRKLNSQRVVYACVGLVLGLLPYAYLFVQAERGNALRYNFPRLLSGSEVLPHILRVYYATVDDAGGTWTDRIVLLRDTVSIFVLDFGVFSLLVLYGILYAYRKRLRERWPVFFGVLGSSVVLICLLNFQSTALSRAVFHVYPIPAAFFLAIFIGIGLSQFFRRYSNQSRLLVGLCVIGLFSQVSYNFPRASHRGDKIVHHWARRYLESLEQSAILVVGGDYAFPLYEVHLLEGVRPDVTFYGENSWMTPDNLYAPSVLFTLPSDQSVQIERAAHVKLIQESTRPVYFRSLDTMLRSGVDYSKTLYAYRPKTPRVPEPTLRRDVSFDFELPPEIRNAFPKDDTWTELLRAEIVDQVLSYQIAYQQLPEDRAWATINEYGYESNFKFLRELATNLVILGRQSFATKVFDRVPETDLLPLHLRTYCRLLTAAERYDRAEPICKARLNIAVPCDTDGMFDYGVLLSKTGRQEAAAEFMHEVLECNPNDERALDGLRQLGKL